MSRLDLYYKAFKDYRKITKNNAETLNERKIIIQNNTDLDYFSTTKFICHIEEDWVKEIEDGLVFVEKALNEERQFIRVQGEITEIEKVKKVSKSSFEHLAKHANLITHLPEKEGDLLVPDNLYVVEKLNDYAVYENRFLYMLLCYLRDFIAFRLEKIYELRSTYIGDFKIDKDVKAGKRSLHIETKIYEKRLDNPYPIEDENINSMLDRINNCQTNVMAFINGPLMTEVAKSPMLKPPITKTNVLKMNNNFKHALALFDYVSSYQGLGYTFEEIKTDYQPFNEKNADELIDTICLTSFVTYKIGNNIEKTLETTYLEEERLAKEAEEKKLDEKIKRLKKKALESGQSLEEYMAMLELRNQQLLHDAEELSVAREEIFNLNKEIDRLNLEIKELNRRIDELKEEIEDKIREISRLNQKYIEDMMAIRKKHAEEIKEIKLEAERVLNETKEAYEKQITDLTESYESKIAEITDSYEKEISDLTENHKLQIKELTEAHQAKLDELEEKYNGTIEDLKENQEIEVNKYKDKIKELNTSIKEIKDDRDEKVNIYENKLKETINSYESTLSSTKNDYENQLKNEVSKNDGYIYERNLYMGELDAKRILAGEMTPSNEFATKERFLELEEEFYAFERFFKTEWKIVKKKLREQAKDPNSEINKRIEEERLEKEALKQAKKQKEKDVPIDNEDNEALLEEQENVTVEETNEVVTEESTVTVSEEVKEEKPKRKSKKGE